MARVAERRGQRTAADVIAEREERLRTDPEYAAQVKAFEDEQAATAAAMRRAERPVLEDLARSGIDLDTVWNLYKFPESRDRVIPVLLRHLVLDYPDRVLQGIGQGLADKSARPWWTELKLCTSSRSVRLSRTGSLGHLLSARSASTTTTCSRSLAMRPWVRVASTSCAPSTGSATGSVRVRADWSSSDSRKTQC